MPPSIASLTSRWAAPDAAALGTLRTLLLAALHLAALGLMLWSEVAVVPKVVFFFTWGLLNFFWLAVLRRPAVAAALSLVMIVVLILLAIKPDLEGRVLLALALVLPALTLLWLVDPFRVRLRVAVAGFAACAVALVGMALAFPQEEWDACAGENYVSKFSRSGVAAMSELVTHGYMEADATITDRLRTLPGSVCAPGGKPPHIILVHDESSFDIRVLPGVKVPADYGGHFRSFDGKRRHFIVEGAGGPSWYSEYNVLAGLSARSFGRFAYYVTQIAAGRVARGLPTALRRCGYRTFSIYPALGAFMSAKNFQTTTGMQEFLDQGALGTNRIEPDRFYYDVALRMIAREHGKGPMFVFA